MSGRIMIRKLKESLIAAGFLVQVSKEKKEYYKFIIGKKIRGTIYGKEIRIGFPHAEMLIDQSIVAITKQTQDSFYRVEVMIKIGEGLQIED